MGTELETSRIQEKKITPPPRARSSITLGDIRCIDPAGTLPPPQKEKPKLQKIPFKLLIIFSIAGLVLAVITISRYDKLYRHYYTTSHINEYKYIQAKTGLKQSKKVRAKVIEDRSRLLRAYSNRTSQYNKLQYKENNYKKLLNSKTLSLGAVKGDIRVSTAQVEALKVQQELLADRIKEKDGQVSRLTSELLVKINEQEHLIKENIKLTQECRDLKEELDNIGTQITNVE